MRSKRKITILLLLLLVLSTYLLPGCFQPPCFKKFKMLDQKLENLNTKVDSLSVKVDSLQNQSGK